MNKELQVIQTEQQIIEAIGAHIIRGLVHQREFLEMGDMGNFNFTSDQLRIFTFQSELAYQSVFLNVDSFLEGIRTLYFKTPTYCFDDDALIKHDEYVSKVQSLIEKSLKNLQAHKVTAERAQLPQQVIKEIPKFINMSDDRVIDAIENIVRTARIEIDRMSVHGINFKNGWLDDYLKCYAEELIKNLPSEFNQSEYAQIIDIALGRISAFYLKEAA